MALVTLPSPMYWPNICGVIGSPGLGTNSTLSSVGHYQAYIFAAREDMAISHVGFRAGTSAGSPTVEVRIETVDASGLPSGTLWATNTNGTTGTVSSNTDVLQALTATASITKGQIFCVKLALASGTSQIIQQNTNVLIPGPTVLPYQVINTGTPTKFAFNNLSTCLALGSSSTSFYYVPGCLPVNAYGTGTFNNTNSAKRGIRFVIPFNCRAIGIRNHTSTSNGDVNAILFSDAGSELSSSSTAYDGDQSGLTNQGPCSYYFDNAVSLTAGTAYRMVLEPSTTTNTNVVPITLPSSNYFGATPFGSAGVYTSFATSTWTDSTTQIALMDLIIDQVDNGSGGGGGGVIGVIGG